MRYKGDFVCMLFDMDCRGCRKGYVRVVVGKGKNLSFINANKINVGFNLWGILVIIWG